MSENPEDHKKSHTAVKGGVKKDENTTVAAIQDPVVLDQVAVQDYWFSCWLYKAKRHF